MPKRFKTLSQSPGVFVGKNNYPNIPVGFLSTYKDNHHDDPLFWAKENFKIPSVTNLRHQLTNMQKVTHTKKKEPFLDIAQELALSLKPIDFEITHQAAFGKMHAKDSETIPYGPKAAIEKIDPQENISGDPRLEQYKDDIDCNATIGLTELYAKGIDEHKLMQMLSIGNLGRGVDRKLVPTRWSITATDDTLGKEMQKALSSYDTHQNAIFTADYLGNYFFILLFEGPFSFEFLEVLPTSGKIMRDHELSFGRKQYAQNTAGGYYATKMPIVEYLTKQQKQASVIAVRFITDEYYQSLGVWVVRETVKKAFSKKPMDFESDQAMQNFVNTYSKRKFNLDIPFFSSPVLKNLKNQSSLLRFM